MITAIRKSIAAKQEKLTKDEKGFTLVELLVVILIIGILTAIAVPVFIGQQDQAKDAATKSDLGVAKVALISWFTANPDGSDPDSTDLADYGYKQSSEAGALTIDATSSTVFCIEATTTDTDNTFSITGSGGVTETECP